MRQGLWDENVRVAAGIAHDMMRKGYSVINPIGSWLCQLVCPEKFDDWLDNDFGLIEVSDVVFRIPGPSEGADSECDFAVRHEIDLYYDLCDFYGKVPTERSRNEANT